MQVDSVSAAHSAARQVPARLSPLRLLRAHAQFHLVRHGWPLSLGLLLIGCAAAVALFATPPLREQAESRVLAQRAARDSRQLPQTDPQALKRQQWGNFYAGLPAADGALEAVAAIQRVAAAHGVELAHGEYRLSRDAGAPLLRYQITLPARSDYPRLRAWIGDVMNAVPSVSLDEFSLRRDDAGSATVDARVRFTLYLRAP